MHGCTKEESKGVDLNRNYDFFFGMDETSSSGKPCAEDYRGPYAFSEPETRAIRDFVIENKTTLKFAVNFHAFGNLLITPFNGSSARNNILKRFSKAHKFYKELYKARKTRPYKNKMGNGAQTIKYRASGEASDWMLGKMNVIAMSPELGTSSRRTEAFWLRSDSAIEEVCSVNSRWLEFVFAKLETKGGKRVKGKSWKRAKVQSKSVIISSELSS